jgi:hypothetical protein
MKEMRNVSNPKTAIPSKPKLLLNKPMTKYLQVQIRHWVEF